MKHEDAMKFGNSFMDLHAPKKPELKIFERLSVYNAANNSIVALFYENYKERNR